MFFHQPRPHGRLPPCGFYYIIPSQPPQKRYLPQVKLSAHATILSTTSRTVLTQTFVNSSSEGIKEAVYTFPLYDGVSVVSFECSIGQRVIKGVVKEKHKARAAFKEAAERGEAAGLLEQDANAADVYSTKVANIPAGEQAIVKITYLGELKNDADLDGVRYTIPTIIAPRYSGYNQSSAAAFPTQAGTFGGHGVATTAGGIEVTIDVVMAEGTIKSVQSPSHPISASIGNTSVAPDAAAAMHKASATLSLGTTELEKDFVLMVQAKETGTPKAILETHPTIANQRALLTTLVPRFSLPQEKPEIVFIADRSGSMHDKIPTLVRALELFLKSLPVGVRFNICSFGSSYSLLWPKSKAYSQDSLDEAIQHVAGFAADFGGTEMLMPVTGVIENRFEDLPLEVMLLTDGQIWNQQALFDYLNEQVKLSQGQIRVFTLGIGDSVSHALIEGIARAGNGFSQAVIEGEQMSKKVVRMLKGGLTPHINNYTLSVKYAAPQQGPDDFELVDKVAECLEECVIDEPEEADTSKSAEAEKKPISLYNKDADLDKEDRPMPDATGEGRYDHLATVHPPKLLQAPHNIPPLFPFIRSSVYLLLAPETFHQQPTSVLLHAESRHGPLELEIPVQALPTPGETIHQLAAKKAVQDLEEGRGWLNDAWTTDGTSIKEKYPSRFDELVEREAVRLGVQYQVGGKWCSFVAVENQEEVSRSEVPEPNEGSVHMLASSRVDARFRPAAFGAGGAPKRKAAGRGIPSKMARRSAPSFGTQAVAAAAAPPPPAPTGSSLSPRAASAVAPSGALFGAGASTALLSRSGTNNKETGGPFGGKTEADPLQELVSLQTFEGFWRLDDTLLRAISVDPKESKRALDGIASSLEQELKEEVWATVLVVKFLEVKLSDEKDAWELIVDKAMAWLEEQTEEEQREELLEKAGQIVKA